MWMANFSTDIYASDHNLMQYNISVFAFENHVAQYPSKHDEPVLV